MGAGRAREQGNVVAKWLSVEWFDEARSMAADQPGYPGLTGGIQVEITGGPDGERSYYEVLEDGRPAGAAPGRIEDPEVTVTLGWDDAVAVHRGHLDPNVAFMQGRMKVAGRMAVVLALLAVSGTPERRRLRRRIAAVTDY